MRQGINPAIINEWLEYYEILQVLVTAGRRLTDYAFYLLPLKFTSIINETYQGIVILKNNRYEQKGTSENSINMAPIRADKKDIKIMANRFIVHVL